MEGKFLSPVHQRIFLCVSDRSFSFPFVLRPGASFLVGWPPVRSFRKKQGSSSFKQTARNESPEKSKANGVSRKTMLVKVNVDGIPIGRKIDLEAHRSYDELVSAVDELFCGLLAGDQCLNLHFTKIDLFALSLIRLLSTSCFS